MSDRLGTAQWQPDALVPQRYPFAEGKFWFGRGADGSPIGHSDDRHICLVSGTRGGKGASIIINNLCFWPGSAVVLDPKGENATVTAARRGKGDDHCVGMGQVVHVLDPFNEAHVDPSYRSSFNPLADLDPNSDETLEEVSRIANAIVVVKDNAPEPMWDERARYLVHGLILHVLTAAEFTDDERNLITVRKLVRQGEWRVAAALREMGHEETMDPPHMLLWKAMELNPAFDGIVAGIGSEFRYMMKSAEKTYLGIFNAASQNTEFLDFPGMRRVLASSKDGFKLSELKTRPEGVTLYLSLPQRAIENTHYRWLRMMVTLTTTQMEITRGRPATGHPVLLVLDEFAGLKRMTAIENAAAQLAGWGVKLFFVLQTLKQLEATYKENWETFLANAGVKIFFSIEDHFTREHVSKLVGETEMIREAHSSNESRSRNESFAAGTSQSDTAGTSTSETEGKNWSHSFTEAFGTGDTSGSTSGSSSGSSSTFGQHGSSTFSSGSNSSASHSRSNSHNTAFGHTFGGSSSTTDGESSSHTNGASQTHTTGKSRTQGTGRSETFHRRALIQPDEVGRIFARIDDKTNPFYPGLALVTISGADPMMVRRTHYFEDAQFIDCFSPHPDHAFLPAIANSVDGIRPLIEKLEAVMNGRRLKIMQWFIEPGVMTLPREPAAMIANVPPDNRTVHIWVPYGGKVSKTAELRGESSLMPEETEIPNGSLFTVKNYGEQNNGIDPFSELRAACRALEKTTEKESGLELVLGMIVLVAIGAGVIWVIHWLFFT